MIDKLQIRLERSVQEEKFEKAAQIRDLINFLSKLNVPTIITANCFFWKPCNSAGARRWNENKKQKEVKDFFISLGFSEKREGVYILDICEVHFSYEESASNVYKKFIVYLNGKKSNINGLWKFLMPKS